MVLAGCALGPPPTAPSPPVPPVPPSTARQSLELVVNTPPVLDFTQGDSIKEPQSRTFAVMDFGSPSAEAQQGGAGVSAADTVARSLGQRGIRVIERERMAQIAAEDASGRGSTIVSEQERAQRIGRLAGADFVIIGAVTEYKREMRDVELGEFIPENERQRYEAEYQGYQRTLTEYQQAVARYVEDFQQYRQKAAGHGERVFLAKIPSINRGSAKSLEQLEVEVRSRRSKRELTAVARIELAGRVIDVRTGRVVWVGHGAQQHVQLQEGMQILVSAFVETILRQ